MQLSDYMKQRGLSDEELAAATGRSRATVSRWRRRKLRPSWDALERIRNFTNGQVTAEAWFPDAQAAE